MIKIAPSILAADFSRLAEEVKLVEEGGADFLHFDIMDGRFVPNISFGPVVIKNIRAETKLSLEAHLMVEEPYRFIMPFVEVGIDMITIHAECFHQLHSTIRIIKSLGKKVGIALNPPTPLESVQYLIHDIDMLLLMTVDPGFGEQRFIHEMLPKIRQARQIIDEKGLQTDLAIDGGINVETASLAIKEGANVLIVGSTIFKEKEPKKALKELRRHLL